MAEQLVEVPTNPAYVLLVIASSVLGGGGGPQRFLPEQSSTASVAEQIVEISVPRGDLHGLRPGHSLQRTVEQIVDNPVPRGRRGGGGGLQGFRPRQVPTASSSLPGAVDEAFHVCGVRPPVRT